ncbi:AroM family protein [Wukongibacter sp. M2B1]|uniref:AroM family protein n=1 Tax=Wukongibacter sp. M2B1 TaxID=3088895 RepID=UPI003D7A84A0
MNAKLGIITIGQSPRVDLTGDMLNILRKDIEVIERGVLDSFTLKEVNEYFRPIEGEARLVSRMRDGNQVILDEGKIIKELQTVIYELEKEVDMILLLCTGKFPKLYSKKTLIMPKPIVKSVIDVLRDGKKIGVVIPDISQKEDIELWWKSVEIDVEIFAYSPYTSNCPIDNIVFKDDSIEHIVLDCMGYTQEIKSKIIEKTGKKVILPRTLLARIINEILYI